MRAVSVSSPGGPEVLGWQEVPDPGPPGPGEVLVHVAASAVNRADLMQRQGFYPPPPGASDVMGLECSGVVAAVGDGVTGWAQGDEVCALLAGGGYAEQVLVPAGQLLPVPAGVSLVEAAGLPEVVCTVWANVFSPRFGAGLLDGESLLVHGGSSGIGTAAIQLAKAIRAGVTVLVTAGSAAKLARCAELGADVGISYRDEDFVERGRQATGGVGVDVVLDNMGASYLARNVAVLAPDGRLAVIGLQGGTTAELDLRVLLAKRGTVRAAGLRARPTQEKAVVVAGVLAEVWPAVEAGRVRPVVDRVLPMSQAGLAHETVEASGHIGKVLLTSGA